MSSETLFKRSFPLRWRCAIAGLIAPACAFATTAAPDAPADLTTVPLEQLLTLEVFSASKFVQKASEAPSSVTVISATDIRTHGWRTLADVARSVRGLYVNEDRNYSYLGARGFLRPGDYNTRFLLQVDGNRINDGVYDQAPLGGEFPLELDLIERIEFVPGPGSSIYGSNAFFGVINVITKKPASLQGVRTAIEAGSAGARKIGASIGWHGERTSMLFAASRHRSDGDDLYYPEFDTPEQNNGIATGRDYEHGERLFFSAVRGGLTLTAMHAKRTKGVPTAAFAQPFNDPRSRTIDRQSYLNLAWRTRLGEQEDLTARLFTGQYNSMGDYAIDNEARTLSHDGSRAAWWGTEVNVVSTRWRGHTVVAGFELQRDYRLRQFSFENDPYTVYLDAAKRGTRAGMYLQDEIAVGDATLLNLGMRFDQGSGGNGVLSPRLALIQSLGAATTVKALYGGAFRAPNSFEKFYSYPGAGGQLPNPDLRNEKIRSGELALEHRVDQRTRFAASLFRNTVNGLITQYQLEEQPETRFENAEQLRAHGAELAYEQGWRGGAAVRASYAWIRLGDDDVARDVSAPARMGKLNASMPVGIAGSPLRVRAAIEAQYMAMRRGPQGTVPGYLLVNANLVSMAFGPGVEASLGITNLLDKRFADPGSYEHAQAAIPQDGRRMRIRLAYVF